MSYPLFFFFFLFSLFLFLLSFYSFLFLLYFLFLLLSLLFFFLSSFEPHGGKLLRGELQVDFLVLGTEEVDFRHVRHAEQFGAHALGIVAQLALSKTIRGERENERVSGPRTRH